MNFERKILPDLIKHLKQKQVTVLTGMRRTGKTTLLKILKETSDIEQKLFFDLERLDHRYLFSEENYDDIPATLSQQGIDFSKKVLICLDEIQLTPNLPSVIKYLYDHYDIKFIVTGSSSYYIRNKFQESMAGRKKIFEIYPLDFGEYLAFKGINYKTINKLDDLKYDLYEYQRLKQYYDDFVEFGGFPEVVLAQSKAEKLDILQDIYSSYMNMDIFLIADIQKPAAMLKIIKLLTTRIGSKIDISKISDTIKISRQTVENYLVALENTYLIKTIPVYSTNADKEIVKAKRLYFTDNGIASINGDLSSGQKIENAIYNQLKHFGEINYYQLKTGNEIDFIINHEFVFEVKEYAYTNDYSKMMRLANNISINKGFVLSKNLNPDSPTIIWGGMIK